MASSDTEAMNPKARLGPVIEESPPVQEETKHQGLILAGGFLGALAVSTCCILPLALFSLGLGGAWIGNLTALAPYKPLFAVLTAAVLGYGFFRVYRKPTQACGGGDACAGDGCGRPASNRLMKVGLWAASILAVVGFAFDYVAPLMLGS